MRNSPSDHQCLRAAERALTEHLATQAASVEHALLQAGEQRVRAAAYDAHARGGPVANWMPPSADPVWNAHAAFLCRQQADAWDRVAVDPQAVYDATTRELERRGAYYRSRIMQRRVTSA